MAVKAVAAEQAASSTTGQAHGRVFNFSAGPAVLPVSVLEQAQADLLNWHGSGGWGWAGLGWAIECWQPSSKQHAHLAVV